MSEKKIAFSPVYGTKERINAWPHSTGSIYFSTDSGEIYLDTEEERVKVGSSSAGASLFYSTQFTDEDTQIPTVDDHPNWYLLTAAYVDTGDATIKADDLIIGTDGAFYRFLMLDGNNNFICSRIAISGAGGGGVVPVEQDLFLEYEGIDILGSTFIYGQHNTLVFTPRSTADGYVSYLLKAKDLTGNNPDIERQGRLYNGDHFDFDTFLLPKSNNIEISVTINSPSAQYNRGKGLTMTFSPIKVLEIYLIKPANVTVGIARTDTSVRYIPYFEGLGDVQTSPVKINYSIDNDDTVVSTLLASGNSKFEQYVNIPMQSHGMHTIHLWLTVTMNAQDYRSSEITYEVPFVETNNDKSIIWVKDELGTITNYEPAVVEYMVYNSTAAAQGSSIEVSLYHKNELLNTEAVTYATGSWLTMDLTPYYEFVEDGTCENSFSLVCGPVSKTINFIVDDAGARDLSLKYPNQLRMNFDALGRSNTEIRANRNKWKSKTNDYEATLKDFNWYTNGWKNDKDGNGSYLSVANGASVTLPLPRLSGESSISMNTADQPWSFEVRFRIRNAKKFATLVTEIPKYRYIYTIDGTDYESELGQEKTLEEIQAMGNARPMLDSDGNMVMNEANTTKKVVQTEKYVAMKFLNNLNEGFAIGTQEAYFNTSGSTVNVKYKENEIINITFVVDRENDALSIYLNGILSGVGSLSAITPISMGSTVKFEINSQYCDFDLYKFRAYPVALKMPDVIHNYIADIKDINIYDENHLTDINDPTKLDYHALLDYNESHPDSPTMPYAVIDMTATAQGTDLPHAKGNKRLVRIEFTNPVADYLLNSEQITPFEYYTHCPSFSANGVELDVQGTSSQKYPRRNFKAKFKKATDWVYSNGELAGSAVPDGGELQSGQTLTGNWHVDHATIGSNTFTWKIDYMESSGSYNTGFVNLMGSGIYDKHPLEDLNISGINPDDYRVNVYGFPMLVFHKTGPDTYTYIGRYNMNLDKSSNERYGFELKKPHPYVTDPETGDPLTIKEVAECWELRDNQGTWCSFRFPNAEARYNGFRTLMAGSNATEPRYEVAQHFEARYHVNADQFEYAQNIILGKSNDKDYSADIGGSTKTAACNYVYNKLSHLESLFKWLDSTDQSVLPLDASNYATLSEPVRILVSGKITKKINNPDFDYDAYAEDPDHYEEPEFINVPDEEEIARQAVTYETEVVGGIERIYGIFTKDSKEYRRQKFYSEFEKHLDLDYCTTYFVMTELMLCYDSRGKNMMIATWGPREEGGDFIWYPIFYDVDTQLGLNNVGAKLWDYDEDCTENGTFSTKDSVLWTNLYDVFRTKVLEKYISLRKDKIDEKTIEDAYMCRGGTTFDSYAMQGKRPIIAIGLDEYYKYVLPVTHEWKDQEGNMTTANYLYACQGDRILSRELLIENRLLYMDSKWGGGSFSINTGGMAGANFRSTGNKPSTSSDIYLNGKRWDATANAYVNDSTVEYPMAYYDAVPEYKVTPYLNFYVTTFVDENTFQCDQAYNEVTWPDGIPTVISPSVAEGYKSGKVDQQLNYFAGSKYISSFGDLSTKYMNEIHFPNTHRLLDISLGSDAPGYFNAETLNPLELYTEVNMDGSVKPGHEKSLLQKINLTNMRGVNTYLDIRSPQKLEEFRALGTSLKYALFANGAPLNTVHLPNTVQRLVFTQNKELRKIITETPVVADLIDDPDNAGKKKLVYRPHESYEGLFVDGITNYDYENARGGEDSPITEISFDGDALGYGSYIVLRNLVNRLKGLGRGKRLSIRMADINWTPYVQVEYGEPKLINVDYYYLTDHSTFETYDRPDDDWYQDTLNGKVYTYTTDETMDESIIQNMDLFKLFYNDYINTPEGEINQFTNNVESMINQKTYPTISGEVYIANSADDPVAESDLTGKYAVAFPNLKIRVAHVLPAYIAKFVQRTKVTDTAWRDDELDVIRLSTDDYTGESPYRTTKMPEMQHQTFLGWSLNPEGTQMVWTYNRVTQSFDDGAYIDDAAFKFSASNSVITLYAIFEIEQLGVKFFDSNNELIREGSQPVMYIHADGTQEEVTKLVPYDTVLPALTVVPYKDDSSLALTETYALKGWATVPSTTPRQADTIVDISNKVVTSNLSYYAVFEVKSVYANVLPQNFLSWTFKQKSATDATQMAEIRIADGYQIRGKVTLPARITVNGISYPVRQIADGPAKNPATNPEYTSNGFAYNNAITAIFWEDGAEPIEYRTNCLRSCKSLKWVDIPSTITTIGDQAFLECKSLLNRDLSDTNIQSIGNSGFNGAFGADSPYGSTLYLPARLQSIYALGVAFNDGIITAIQFGKPGQPTLGIPHEPSQLTILDDQERYRIFANQTYAVTAYVNDPTASIWALLGSYVGTGNLSIINVNDIAG